MRTEPASAVSARRGGSRPEGLSPPRLQHGHAPVECRTSHILQLTVEQPVEGQLNLKADRGDESLEAGY